MKKQEIKKELAAAFKQLEDLVTNTHFTQEEKETISKDTLSGIKRLQAMNDLQKKALKELEELEINHAETGRDREPCYPSVEEEEEMSTLSGVIDGCPESTKAYVLSKIDTQCHTCCLLDLSCEGTEPVKKGFKLNCYLAGPE